MKSQLGPVYQDHDLVVSNLIGTPIDLGYINRDMNYVIEKHNLLSITFHQLRHTHATMLLKIGENPAEATTP